MCQKYNERDDDSVRTISSFRIPVLGPRGIIRPPISASEMAGVACVVDGCSPFTGKDLFEHIRASKEPGTPQDVAVNGRLADVVQVRRARLRKVFDYSVAIRGRGLVDGFDVTEPGGGTVFSFFQHHEASRHEGPCVAHPSLVAARPAGGDPSQAPEAFPWARKRCRKNLRVSPCKIRSQNMCDLRFISRIVPPG